MCVSERDRFVTPLVLGRRCGRGTHHQSGRSLWSHGGFYSSPFLSHFLEVTDATLTFAYDLQLSISLISILHFTIPPTPKKPVPLVKPDNVSSKGNSCNFRLIRLLLLEHTINNGPIYNERWYPFSLQPLWEPFQLKERSFHNQIIFRLEK